MYKYTEIIFENNSYEIIHGEMKTTGKYLIQIWNKIVSPKRALCVAVEGNITFANPDIALSLVDDARVLSEKLWHNYKIKGDICTP